MKKKFNVVSIMWLITFFTFVSFMILYSCKKEDTGLGGVPVISLSSTQLSNATGGMISTTLNISAPEGLKSLVILKNGVPFDTEDIAGNPVNFSWDFSYEIDESIGSEIVFTFQAVDSKDRNSTTGVLTVHVTAKPFKNINPGNLIGNHTWSADTIYRLVGFVRVGKDVDNGDGTFTNQTGVLTIQAGTVIVGDKQTKGTLIVQRGSKLNAIGTVDAPIVFTSEQPIGQRLPGDWGGVVLCGRTVNNQGPNIELEGGYGGYHGGNKILTDETESSGTLKYVRIEYAGVPINPNQEINSLTMGSVGKGTVIDYVQCSYGLDDSYEWFGGSVNCKHIIAYRGLDDDFDNDYGYQGYVQFALGIRDAALADQSGSNGFEVDNNGAGTAVEPYTAARFANVTLIGPKKTKETPINTNFQHGAQLRRNSTLRIYNSFITGYPWGIYIDDSKGVTSQWALNDSLRLRNVIIAGVQDWGGNGYGSVYDSNTEGTITGLPFGTNVKHPTSPTGISLKQDATSGFNVVDWFGTSAYKNVRLASWSDAGINSTVFDIIENPVFLPQAGSLLLNSADWDNVPEKEGFQQVTYIGAFGNVDWTAGWTEFVPGVKVYF